MSEGGASEARVFVRPRLDTCFHIDFEWWDRADRELEIYLRSHLCEKHQDSFGEMEGDVLVDTVHPETGEVSRVAGIQHVLISHCALQPDYLTPQTTLVDAVFRVFLANGNTPMTPEELGERLNKPANTILRTLSSARVYKGIRPLPQD